MFGLKSNSAPKTAPVYVIVYRNPGARGFQETATHQQAMDAFTGCVALGHFEPHAHRRMYITGPDYVVQPDDPSDPLLIGAAALRAVLTENEYAAVTR